MIFCLFQAICYLSTRLSLKNELKNPLAIQNIGCSWSAWNVRKNRKKASESCLLRILCVVAFFPICAYTRIVCALTAGSFFWSRSFLYAYTCWLRKLRKKPVNLNFFKKIARIPNKTVFGANRTRWTPRARLKVYRTAFWHVSCYFIQFFKKIKKLKKLRKPI